MTQQDTTENATIDDNTLEPPGIIGVIGAGVTGIEAALYGRFLGYDVHVFERDRVAASWMQCLEQSLPVGPADCLSPLAKSALQAQRRDDQPITWPLTVGPWVDDFLKPLCETDLLRGRIHLSAVSGIELVENEDDVPADFRLSLESQDNPTFDCEAIISTLSADQHRDLSAPSSAEYFFTTVGSDQDVFARRRVVEIYATLGGRADLDLYRPQRL